MTSESNSTKMNSSATTLVLGGTGRTGRRVMKRLAGRGAATRVGSRSGSPPFDWQHPAGWPAVLDGVDSAYLCYHPDLAVTGAADTVGAFARAAVGAGVSRLLVTTVSVPRAAYLAAMADAGVPREVTDLMGYLFTEVLDGRNAVIGDGVERALGRPARDFADFARAASAAGAWDRTSAVH